jgi:two-component system alkaline phosphatase synthesis response regulator PhoP
MMSRHVTKILFIDDDPAFAEEMKFLLQQNGYEVITAADGQEAFQLAKEQVFDVVITDMLLTTTNGTEVILHMRTFHPGVRIIAITGGGWASPQFHLDSARVIGSDSCLAKPFSIESLLKEIRQVVSDSQARH